MLESAQAMGLRSLTQESSWYGLSLTLGGGEVTLLDLTTAFATLANAGTYVEPTPFLAVADALGRPFELPQAEVRQAVSPAAAFQVTDILSDNAARTPAFGANNPLRLSRPAAVKTGTTSDWRDNWTVGYTRYLVAGVWAGNSDGRPMRNTSGLTGAAPIWSDFMQAVLADPALLATLEAAEDPAAWQFHPPTDMERRGRLSTRPVLPGGRRVLQPRLAGRHRRGRPVGRQRGLGAHRAGLRGARPRRPVGRLLPGGAGPAAAAAAAARWIGSSSAGPGACTAQPPSQEQHAMAWALRNPTAINLGPCDAWAS